MCSYVHINAQNTTCLVGRERVGVGLCWITVNFPEVFSIMVVIGRPTVHGWLPSGCRSFISIPIDLNTDCYPLPVPVTEPEDKVFATKRKVNLDGLRICCQVGIGAGVLASRMSLPEVRMMLYSN